MELRKKGFKEPCVGYYLDIMDDDSTLPHLLTNYINNSKIYNTEECTAPTYDQVVGWFVNNGIEIDMTSYEDETYSADVVVRYNWKIVYEAKPSESRQTALLTAFEEALKLI